MNKKVKIGLMVLLAWFVLHCAFIIIDGVYDEVDSVDVIVVLGNRVEENGEPSERLKSRLDKALYYYNTGLSGKIIVSGGFGDEGYEEADVMKAYLMNNEVSDEDIIADREGFNTYATAVNTKEIMDREGMRSVMVISQYYHITRTKLAFWKVGIKNVFSAHAEMSPELRDFYSVPREFFGFYSYLFL